MKLSGTKASHIFLYVFASSKNDHLYKLQMESLADRESSSTEHHIVIAKIFEEDQGQICSHVISRDMCQKLRLKYHVMPGQFTVVLLGKNSTVKLFTHSCVSYEEILMRLEY